MTESLDSETWSQLNVVERALRNGRIHEAERAAQNCVRCATSLGEGAIALVYTRLSLLFRGRGGPAGVSLALDFAHEALKLASDCPEPHATYARALFAAGRPAAALKHFDLAAAMYGAEFRETSYERRTVLGEMCTAAIACGRLRSAELAAKELLQWTPRDDSVACALALHHAGCLPI